MTDEEKGSSSSTSDAKPSLNAKNYANLVAYILNILFTYLVGQAGLFGAEDNATLSERYQTIITPAGFAFIIWSVIFTSQGVFAVLQMLPTFRGRPMVQQGVSYWYVSVCLSQIAWTFSFGFEVIPLSLVFMLVIWISLMGLLISQYYVELDPETSSCSGKGLGEYWALRFPFAIHGGWITAATALNVNVISVWRKDLAPTQLSVGIISLAVLHALSVWHLFGYKRPNYTIPLVLAWANGFIYQELQDPKSLITETFDPSIVTGVGYAALSVSIIILTQVVLRVGFFVFNYIKGTSYVQESDKTAEE